MQQHRANVDTTAGTSAMETIITAPWAAETIMAAGLIPFEDQSIGFIPRVAGGLPVGRHQRPHWRN